MVGLGMIFDETYRPFFEQAHHQGGIYDKSFGVCEVKLSAVASRTGSRAEAYRKAAGSKIAQFESFKEPDSIGQLLNSGVDFVCVASPDDRHFSAAKAAILAGKHVREPDLKHRLVRSELERLSVKIFSFCELILALGARCSAQQLVSCEQKCFLPFRFEFRLGDSKRLQLRI